MFCVCVVPMDSLNGELLFHYTIPNEIVLMHTVLKVLFVWSLGGVAVLDVDENSGTNNQG